MSENYDPKKIFELTPDILDQVTGGVVTDRAEIVMDVLIKTLKNDANAVHTPEETIDFITSYLMDNINFADVTEEDVRNYVTTNWDKF